MQDEYLTRCVVDPMNRKFFIYSSEGDERVVDCETIDQFMSVLDLVRSQCADNVIAYVNPLDCAKIDSWFQKSRKKNSGKNLPHYFFMNSYSPDFYQEILKCYEYETRNPTIYGNVIRGEMEFTKSSEKLWIDGKRDEDNV